MIDVREPDFSNTPASPRRPDYRYAPRNYATPTVSVITPYYNTGAVFWDTVRSIQRMTYGHWEWIIVDDESSDPASLAQLEHIERLDARIRVIHQRNAGPAVARNQAARTSRGKYLLQIDSDDMIEPTFVEKAIWFLETQPQFAACNSKNVTFGSKNFLWPHGFEEYEHNLRQNWVTNQAVIRRDAFFLAGEYDEAISYEHADWDFWLNLAEAGLWGYTLPEYLTWYRTQEQSLLIEIESDRQRSRSFRSWLDKKHARLATRFPHPVRPRSLDIPYPTIRTDIPVTNDLEKPASKTSVLLVVPWLEIGGADKFNLDLMRAMSARGYAFTVATTLHAEHAWLSKFAEITPDIFCMHQFLNFSDYPRFLDYLIRSRQIDAVVISNSELGYALVPYLRAQHPTLAILDYTHSETEDWKSGGYPGMAVRLGRQLDLNLTNTLHLKRWMIARGADPDYVEVCRCAIDTHEWDVSRYDTAALRRELGFDIEIPIVLFVGRFSPEKRVLVFLKIVRALAEQGESFVALLVGSGEQLDLAERFVRKHGLEKWVRFLGAQPEERVREIMAIGDILVLPSQIEGLALVLFECLAMGTVPVAVDIAGHPELVTPECGYLIPHGEGEEQAYIQPIVRLLHDQEFRYRMAKRGREVVADTADLKHLADHMESAITRARQIASARTAPDALQVSLVLYATHTAIEYMRMEELSNLLWAERHKTPSVDFLRALRARILPIGSDRYEVYKLLRQTLREMRLKVRQTAKYLRVIGSAYGAPDREAHLRLPVSAETLEQSTEVAAKVSMED